MAADSLGVYIHIPFCVRKCAYCSFYSSPADETVRQAYTEALCRDILSYGGRGLGCDTVYFGGGTPTALESGQLIKILEAVKTAFDMDSDAEVTLEANPDSAAPEKLEALRAAGFNRISFGVQSLDDRELSALGRLHDSKKAVMAVKNARAAGFENISCDMMLGIPYQDTSSMLATAKGLTSLGISHISAYMLSVEEGTPFFEQGIEVDDDRLADMYLALCEQLGSEGFEHYEISNFAKQNRRSRHNMRYWQGREYLGFGCKAHSFFEDKRFFCDEDIKTYISSDSHRLTVLEEHPDRLEEYILLGLRTSDGISFERLKELGADEERLQRIRECAVMLESHGLCRFSGSGFSLTEKGFLSSNAVIAQLELC